MLIIRGPVANETGKLLLSQEHLLAAIPGRGAIVWDANKSSDPIISMVQVNSLVTFEILLITPNDL